MDDMKASALGKDDRIVLVKKADDFYAQKAADFVKRHFTNFTIVSGGRGDAIPSELDHWEGDWLISYLSPWIIPAGILQCARKAAVNIHPGPPEYPGIGCTNFAVYEGQHEFGVTCHHMAPRVDTGKIISVTRFPLYESDTVFSLTQRCYAHILTLFYRICSYILAVKPLPESEETWQRRPFKRTELNALCRITPDMPNDEISRRIRATTFPGAPGAYIELDGHRFTYTPVKTES